jgi:hypothetical protein
MQKKTVGKDSTKGKARRKLTDLSPKRVKRGEASAVKGGPSDYYIWVNK